MPGATRGAAFRTDRSGVLILLLLAAVVRGTAAGDESPKRPDIPPGPPVSAVGIVTDDDGKPIAGATVYLREWSLLRYSQSPNDTRPQDLLATTTTNDKGEFTFRDVPSRAFASHWHYKTPWDLLATAPGRGLSGQHLAPGDGTQPVILKLPAEAVLVGRVLDEEGQPLGDVDVSVASIATLDSDWGASYEDRDVLHLGFSQIAPQVRTGADGRFRIGGLPKDRRMALQFLKAAYVPEYLPAATTNQPQPDLVDGRRQTEPRKVYTGDIAVTLRRGWQLTGRILLGDTGKPHAAARLSVSGQNAYFGSTADADGRFKFLNLKSADGNLMVSAPEEGDYLGRSTPFRVDDDSRLHNIDVVLPRGTILTGVVVDEETGAGIAGVTVTDASGDATKPAEGTLFSRAVVTDKDGRFRLAAVPGNRQLRITGPVPDYDAPDRVAYLRTPGGVPARFTRNVEVAADKPLEELRFTLSRGLTMTGTVTDPDGKPVAEAEIRSVTSYGEVVKDAVARSDAAGRFKLGGFPVASAQRLVISHADRRLKGQFRVPALVGDGAQSTRAVEVDAKLSLTGRVVGRLIDGRQPLPGVRVQVYEHATENGEMIGRFTGVASHTDALGNFALELVETDHKVYLSIEADSHERLRSIREFQVDPGQTHEVPEITLRRLDQTVSGIVVDPDGNPVEGVTIAASDRKTRQSISLVRGQSTVTGKDGRFTMRHVPDTPLTLMAYFPPGRDEKDRRIRFPAQVDAEPGQTDVRIVLDPKLARPTVKKIVPVEQK